MKRPESKHYNANNLGQTAHGQIDSEADQPLSDEELENIAGGIQDPTPGIDPSLQRKDKLEGGLPQPLSIKGVMGH